MSTSSNSPSNGHDLLSSSEEVRATELMTNLMPGIALERKRAEEAGASARPLEPRARSRGLRNRIAGAIVNPAHDGGTTFALLLAVQFGLLAASFGLGFMLATP